MDTNNRPSLPGYHIGQTIRMFWLAAGLAMMGSPEMEFDAIEAAYQASISDRYEKREEMIPMRDGKRLYTAIYVPKSAPTPVPFLMQRTPYGCFPYGPGRFPRLGPTGAFADEGYIFVYQDVRGRYMSEDDHIYSPPHKPNKKGTETDESSDTYDTIEWLLKNVPNHNGKVGIYGISQPGFYASNALMNPQHPALVAASPQAPVTDRWKGDDDHHNGAFFLAQRVGFMWNFGHPRPVPSTEGAPPLRFPTRDGYQFFLDIGPLKNLERDIFKGNNKFWQWVMANPDYNEFWQSRATPPHLTKAKGQVMVVGGWYDAEDLYGALKTYGAIAKSPNANARLVMGPWGHGGWAGGDGDRYGAIEFGVKTAVDYREQMILPFFNATLKGKPMPDLARATMFDTGSKEWRKFDAWPPANAKKGRISLRPGGKLDLSETPDARTSFEEYVSDPAKPVPYTQDVSIGMRPTYMIEDQRFASRRTDVLTFVSEPLTGPLSLAGPLNANLFVSTTGTDADFIVKVIDVFPGDTPNPTPNPLRVEMSGYQKLVRAEVMRAKYRDNPAKPTPLVPGRATPVRFEMPDVMHTFLPGHRLMVQVQSSWFPLIDRNPQTFVNINTADEAAFRKATHRLYLGGATASHITFTRL